MRHKILCLNNNRRFNRKIAKKIGVTMTLYKNKYRVESIRLKNYHYGKPGVYFITIVTHNRQCLFGIIENDKMQLYDGGKIAQLCWLNIPNHFPHAQLDEFVILPNHILGIIILNDIANDQNKMNNVGTQNIVETQKIVSLQQKNSFQHIIPGSIGSVVRGFKIGVTKWFRQHTNINTVWQRNYYEHIIHNDEEFFRIRQYIINNPTKWKTDKNYENVVFHKM